MALQQTQAAAKKAAPPSPPKPARMSMNPDTFTSGGLINDVDGNITDAGTVQWDMNGQVDPTTPFLAVEITDDNGTAHTQYYSAGKPEDLQPEESHEGFISPSGKSGINNSTNLGMFLASLVDNGFPKEMLDDGNLKVIIGTRAHFLQKAVERTGLIRTGKNAQRPSTVLLVSKIHSLPGADTVAPAKSPTKPAVGAKPGAAATVSGKPNGKAVGHAAAAAAATTTAPASDIDDADLYSALRGGIPEGETIQVKEIAKLVFGYYNENGMDKLANKAVARSATQAFRSTLNDNGFVYEPPTLGLAE
ncbi:MAG TPA: hypothetical protein VN861_03520 [Candidatus Acidoferrales bacterium]|nr:hypothetical protein [Candidatus Acidoferrales bacterium]